MKTLAASLCLLLAAAGAAAGAPTREVKVVHSVLPTYTLHAGSEMLEGCVTTRFVIEPDGTVGDVSIVESRPSGALDAPTIHALRQWRFEPFEPPAVVAEQTFTFDRNLVKLPDEAVRPSYAVLAGKEGRLANTPCRTTTERKAEGGTPGSGK